MKISSSGSQSPTPNSQSQRSTQRDSSRLSETSISHWVWLSRVMLFGLVGTAALVTVFFAIVGLPGTSNKNGAKSEPDRLKATAITAQEVEALNLPINPPSPPPLAQPNSQASGFSLGLPDSIHNRPSQIAPATQATPTPTSTPTQKATPTEKPKSTNNASGSQPSTKATPTEKPKPTGNTSRPKQSNKSQKPTPVRPPRRFNLQQSLSVFSPLFDTPTSLGMVAIGVAEGNYRLVINNGTLFVQQTPTYFGHTDPGNLSWGQVVTNYGPCSDQGRSGGNIALAEQMCLERARGALPTHLVDLNAAGFELNYELEAVLNTADLYNQASPIHSRYFPQALAIARRGGLKGMEAIAWARTASFYLNANNELDLQTGTNKASGLLGICIREGRPITEWQCVYNDQMRRVKAITNVVEKYRSLVQQRTKKSK